MSRDRLEAMLESCLEGLAAGLSAEECLSAWPEHREALEPVLRQALRLRVAYARAPREQFRNRLREKLLFAAGRDAVRAYSREPDPAFVSRTRRKLLNAAGAAAQESLRAVPPPRLTFWLNARRRFLNAAAGGLPRPAPRPMAFAARTGLSVAMLVLAVAVSGLVYLTAQGGPRSVSAELASLEQQLQQVEEQAASGAQVSPSVLVDLSRRTAVLVDKLSSEEAPAPLAEKLPAIIERQREVVSQVAKDPATAPAELEQARQHLTAAEGKVRVLAARSDTLPALTLGGSSPTAGPAATASPAPVTPSAVPPTPTPAPAPGPGQVRIVPLPTDGTYNLAWVEIVSQEFRAAVPRDWKVLNLDLDGSGLATLEGRYVQLTGPDSVALLLNVRTGQINAIINGQVLLLRDYGVDGKAMGVDDLVARAGALAPVFHHVLETVVMAAPAPIPSPVPTATPTP